MFNSRTVQAGQRISELEDKTFEIIQSVEQQERVKKDQETLHDTIKQNNKHIKEVPEGGWESGRKFI